ncbi:MAG: 2Fe-2S iron-sulfur cluster-binding protein [Bacteroidota bacterium]
MIRVTIHNLSGKTITCNSKTKKLLDVLQENYVDWMHACGAKGRCTTCTAIVVEGMENLQDLTDHEKKFIARKRLQSNERLSCQAVVTGDVVIRVPELYKLPHQKYSE